MLHSQVRPLAGLCNHLWLRGAANCVSWQGGTIRWILQLGRVVGWGSTIASGLAGPQAVFPNWMVLLAGLHIQVGCEQAFLVGQGPVCVL